MIFLNFSEPRGLAEEEAVSELFESSRAFRGQRFSLEKLLVRAARLPTEAMREKLYNFTF